MREISLNIPEEEFERLNALYPANEKSSTVGSRAIEIVEFYFRHKVSTACEFRRGPRRGIDLAITYDGFIEEIEVKGTAKFVAIKGEFDPAWNQLKVSGQPSYRNLLNGGYVAA